MLKIPKVELKTKHILSILLNIVFFFFFFAPMGKFQLELIYLYFPPSSHLLYVCFCPCRPFIVITTLSTGLVGVEVTSVSWLGQLTVGV